MASTYFTDIQKLYVTYFARPADPDGLQYWEAVVEGARGSTAAVSAAFAQSAEYKEVTAGMDAYHAVNTLYLNLFGHGADLDGLNFWALGLIKGSFTVDQAAAVIAAGAQGTDLQVFGLKVSAAAYFTSALDTADKILRYESGTGGPDVGPDWGKNFLWHVTLDNPHPPVEFPYFWTGPIPGGFGGHGPEALTIDLVGSPAAGPDLAGHGIHP
jgi:hypothetical protein